MATAILTVLYPDEFTIYDYRLCEQLGGFHNLATLSRFEDVWHGYEALVNRIRAMTPDGLSLRDRDRYLWGKSTHEQLVSDVARRLGSRQSPRLTQRTAHPDPTSFRLISQSSDC